MSYSLIPFRKKEKKIPESDKAFVRQSHNPISYLVRRKSEKVTKIWIFDASFIAGNYFLEEFLSPEFVCDEVLRLTINES